MKSLALPFIAMLIPLSGCSILENLPSGPTYDPDTLYLTNGVSVRVEDEYLERYECAADVPMVCECFGRAHKNCDCHC